MNHHNAPINCTSRDLEKAAIERFRCLAICIPDNCRVFREPWGISTVLCLDFQDCPNLLEDTQEKAKLIVITAKHLGLANFLIFRIGNKVIGWTNN